MELSINLRSSMARSLIDHSDDWNTAFTKVKELKTAAAGKLLSLFEDLPQNMNTQILLKASLMSIEADFKTAFIDGSACFNDAVLLVLAIMSHTHKTNGDFDAYEVHKEAMQQLASKYSRFLLWFDPTTTLRKYLSRVAMETVSLCEDFKTSWLQFFASDEYLDLVDIGEQHLAEFNTIVLTQAKPIFARYTALTLLIGSPIFERAGIEVKRFSLNLGKLLFDYFCSIGKSSRDQLKRLNDSMSDSKFLTTHIVVAAVARLR